MDVYASSARPSEKFRLKAQSFVTNLVCGTLAFNKAPHERYNAMHDRSNHEGARG